MRTHSSLIYNSLGCATPRSSLLDLHKLATLLVLLCAADVNTGICTRALVKQHDPQLASVLFKLFGDREWRYPQTAPKPWPPPLAPYQRCLTPAVVLHPTPAALHLPIDADQSRAPLLCTH